MEFERQRGSKADSRVLNKQRNVSSLLLPFFSLSFPYLGAYWLSINDHLSSKNWTPNRFIND